ncbi:hypothetical protein F4779DRAFT_576340 [Xylariaceae sp. FL0662B]|nr:hypothetical protein F4779DRAFT_576340 [Xylariaceae sp. FL0662B]
MYTLITCVSISTANEPEQSLAIHSRIDDDLTSHLSCDTMIHSSSGFQFLKKAYETVQSVVFETAKASWPGIWQSHYEDGPHLVRLGRDELSHCIGEYAGYPNLEINGYSTACIRHTLLNVVPLRNSVCHPQQDHLQTATYVDRLLRDAQNVAVKLGDAVNSMAIRTLRDNLRAESVKTHQDIMDYYLLAVLPGATRMGVNWQRHHHEMLNRVLERYKRGQEDGYSEEILVVAKAWAAEFDASEDPGVWEFTG